ncbi:RluA family pseudouridine synthase [Peptococcus simiae]
MQNHHDLKVRAGRDIRLDLWLAAELDTSRSSVRKAVKEGRVFVNGQPVSKAGHLLQEGDNLQVEAPSLIHLTPVDMHLDILYEDDQLLVVNKPAGLLVHPSGNDGEPTLVHGLLAHTRLSAGSEYYRPGIVHRLDRDTSGALLVAKTDRAHVKLAAGFQSHRFLRRYLTIVEGCLPFAFHRVQAPIGRITGHPFKREIKPEGRLAISDIDCLAYSEGYSLAAVRLWTGRTHQVRLHMAHLGHPCLGDWLYGEKRTDLGFKGQALHSWELQFTHPETNRLITIFAPPIGVMEKALLDHFSYYHF